MTVLKVLRPYRDDRGNEIVFDGTPRHSKITVKFLGSNNRLVVAADAKVVELGVTFGGDGSLVEIGPTTKYRTGLRFGIQVGHDSGVRIGRDVGSQGRALIRAVEGADVVIGDDCMLAAGIEVRSDDSHAIYDVRTGKRINVTKSVAVGDHVWIAKHATIMGGAAVGSGAVIGFRSIVTSDIPNNAVAVGAPARVVRRDVAWERPELTGRPPGAPDPYRGIKNSRYWNLTTDEPVARPEALPRPEPIDPAEIAAWVSAVPGRSAASGSRRTLRQLARGARRRAGRLLRR